MPSSRAGSIRRRRIRPGSGASLPEALPRAIVRDALRPAGQDWRIVAVRTVVVGPARFNAGLAASGSKAEVHFAAFRELLDLAWELSADGMPTHLEGDKHGGRHYYLEPLIEALPGTWIDRGPEGPELSRYSIRGTGRELDLSLVPRADAANGLVALASIVSKTVREIWMDVFNAYWTWRIPGLRPTAGYPVDARVGSAAAIEPFGAGAGCDPDVWWRSSERTSTWLRGTSRQGRIGRTRLLSARGRRSGPWSGRRA